MTWVFNNNNNNNNNNKKQTNKHVIKNVNNILNKHNTKKISIIN